MLTSALRHCAGCFLGLAVLPLVARAQEPSGVAGIPVETHEVIGAVQYRGSDRLDIKRLQARLPEEGVLLRLGRPLDVTSICRIRETIKDQMAEQGFPEAVVSHELLPYLPGREHNAKRLMFTITEGRRASPSERRTRPALPPAVRCDG